jgi:DNA polymerase
MWNLLGSMIPQMTRRGFSERVGPVVFEFQRIRLPSGLFLNYHDLENKNGQWWFTYGGKPKYLYGGKMLENIVQALARICVMEAAVRVRKRIGAQLALQVHDELVYVVDDPIASSTLSIVHEEMCRRPSWGVDIPLDAEGDIAQSYGDAK